MRYINTSSKTIEIKLKLFKLDIPENAKVNSVDALFDGDFNSSFELVPQTKVTNTQKKSATQVYIIGATKGISVVYKNGKTVSYAKSHKIKGQKIKAIKASKKARINELIWK